MNVLEAAQDGTERDLLVAMRDRVAQAVADPECPKRDLASLTLRLANIVKDIKALDSAGGDDEIGEAANLPDGQFDPASI